MLISGSTKVFALFGDPVTHSLSPIMQNAAFKALQLDCCYVPFLVREGSLAAAVKAVRELNLGGVNITIPHKERVLAYLDQVDEGALQIGAVNTIVNRDGYLFGYNTGSLIIYFPDSCSYKRY
jgi:shikimate dehydrogenase